MERIEKAKNKLLIFSFLNILLTYTKTSITNFSILDIKFELKKEYIISEFNTIFLFILIYYFIQMSFEIMKFVHEDSYTSLVNKNKKLRNVFINTNNGKFIRYLGVSTVYLLSFNFLYINLPLLIATIAINFTINSNIYLTLTSIIVLEALFFFSTTEISKEIEELEKLSNENTLALKKLELAVDEEKITPNNERMKTINLAIETIQKRKNRLKKELDILYS